MSTELPDLSDEYPLSEAQVQSFRRDGHIHLRGVLSPAEVAAYREAIRDAAYANFPDAADLDERDAFGKAFRQTLNLRLQHEGVRRFALARRSASIAAQLVGAGAVRVYHDQALFKEPGGGLTPWHQDQYYWPLATDQAIGLWMPLIDVSIDMGALMYASGSHRAGFLGQHEISDASQQIYEEYVASNGIDVWSEPVRAGDLLLHSGWTLHGAGANNTDTMREAMIVTYYPDGTRVDELSNPNRVDDARTYLGGRKPGELADSELNTVVYSTAS